LGNEATLGVISEAPYKFWCTGGTTDSINIYPLADSICTVKVSNRPISAVGYSNNCYSLDSAIAIVGEEAKFQIKGDTVGCAGNSVELTVVDGYDILWSTNETTATIAADIYDDSDIVYDATATDDIGCRSTKSITIHGTYAPNIEIRSEDGRDIICRGESILLIASGGERYEWNMFVTDDSLRITPKETFTYTVTGFPDPKLTACTSTASITITVENCDLVYFPSAISLSSPKTVNRIFKPIGIPQSYSQYYLAILNRWGQLIFESDKFETGWNGTHQGENVRAGTYVYKFRLNNNGYVWEKVGTVTVVD
jgi:gliding motility-associated-like protein